MEDSLMKFQIAENKLKMEIGLTELVWLFHNSPNNMSDSGTEEYAKVKKDKQYEFVKWIIEKLQDDSPWDDNNVSWGQMFEDAFNKILEGYETCDEFIEYHDESEEELI